MRAQVAPRLVGVMMSLESTLNPFVIHPSYQSVAALDIPERVQKLRDPALRAKLLEEAAGKAMFDWTLTFPFGDACDYEPLREDSVAARAERAGVSPAEVALDVLLERDGHGILYYAALNYAERNSDVSREMLLHPHTVSGLGDGGAHVSFISDASFPTYMLSHWGRDRSRGEKLPLELLVKKQTRDTAELVSFMDRGLLAEGMKADVNVIDFETLALRRPEMWKDLPAGGNRLVQRADGYRYTLVSGEVAVEDGELTGVMAEGLVRGV